MHPGPGVNSKVDGLRDDAMSLDRALSIEDGVKDLESIAYSSEKAQHALSGRLQDHKNDPKAEGALCKTDLLRAAPAKEDMEVDENKNEVPAHPTGFSETGTPKFVFDATIEFTRSAYRRMAQPVPQEVADMIIDLLRYDPSALRNCTLVSRNWVHRCRKYFPGGGRIVFHNREEVIRVVNNDSRTWTPTEIVVTGEGNGRSLTHLTAVLAKYKSRWKTLYRLKIEHGDWHAGDLHSDIFRYFSVSNIWSLTLNDVTLPSGMVLRQLIFPMSRQQYPSSSLHLTRVRFADASLPHPSQVLRYDADSPTMTSSCDLNLRVLDAASLAVLTHSLLAAQHPNYALMPNIWIMSNHAEGYERPALAPSSLRQLLRVTGGAVHTLRLDVVGSTARHLSPFLSPRLFAYSSNLRLLDLTIFLDEHSISCEWLCEAICKLPESLERFQIDFRIGVHEEDGVIAPEKGPHCNGCARRATPLNNNSDLRAGGIHGMLLQLASICEGLDSRLSRQTEDHNRSLNIGTIRISICRCAALDRHFWKITLGALFPKLKKKKRFADERVVLWCRHCGGSLWSHQEDDTTIVDEPLDSSDEESENCGCDNRSRR